MQRSFCDICGTSVTPETGIAGEGVVVRELSDPPDGSKVSIRLEVVTWINGRTIEGSAICGACLSEEFAAETAQTEDPSEDVTAGGQT